MIPTPCTPNLTIPKGVSGKRRITVGRAYSYIWTLYPCMDIWYLSTFASSGFATEHYPSPEIDT